jgi:hypothetical protein
MFAQSSTNRKIVREVDLVPAAPSNGSRDSVTIRRSAPGDGPALERLSRLDDKRLPRGAYVVAERGDEIVAAAPLGGGATLANPFMLTDQIVGLIELRARQLLA